VHEYSIARTLIQQVKELLAKHAGDQITEVRVSVGEFSGIEADLLSMAYEMLVEGTSLSISKLLVSRVPLAARCGQCDYEFRIERFKFVCPRCNDRRVVVVRGEEMVLESVVMEQAVA
jgi:hydrogenase nickel incorporation protein HypA/HybF